jgi:hypothetical protein
MRDRQYILLLFSRLGRSFPWLNERGIVVAVLMRRCRLIYRKAGRRVEKQTVNDLHL